MAQDDFTPPSPDERVDQPFTPPPVESRVSDAQNIPTLPTQEITPEEQTFAPNSPREIARQQSAPYQPDVITSDQPLLKGEQLPYTEGESAVTRGLKAAQNVVNKFGETLTRPSSIAGILIPPLGLTQAAIGIAQQPGEIKRAFTETPPGSPQRAEAVAGGALSLGMLLFGAKGLREGLRAPEPAITEPTLTQTLGFEKPTEPILPTAEEITKGIPNAIEKPETTQPDGLRAEPKVPQETVPPAASISGEGVPEVRQGQEVPGHASQEPVVPVTPTTETPTATGEVTPQGQAEQPLSGFEKTLSDVQRMKDKLKARTMIYQADAKENLASLLGQPRDTFYHIPYEGAGGWQEISGHVKDFENQAEQAFHEKKSEIPEFSRMTEKSKLGEIWKAYKQFADRTGEKTSLDNIATSPVSEAGQPPVAPVTPKETAPEVAAPVPDEAAPVTESIPVHEQPVTEQPEDGRTTGIAQRITGVAAGEGISAEESVTRGRELLSQGANPEEISARIKATKQISADDLSVLRAREEQLTKNVYAAGDLAKAQPNDPVAQQEFKSALAARNQWREEHVKPAQTQWSDIGRAQQGQTDIDTGTFTGLRMAFMDAKGRDATPAEQTKLTDLADKTQDATAKVDEAKSSYDQAVTNATEKVAPINPNELTQHFADRITDPNAKTFDFTQPEIASIWKYAKDNYIDKGVTSLDDTIHGIALDTGLKPEWVADALTKPKAIRQITNDLYARMAARRNMVNAAKDYINAKDEPLWKRVAKAVWETPFSLAIYGHGTVGGITHAGANIFRPSVWSAYWPDFVNQAKFFARPGIHEAAMQTLVRDPNFITAKRAGLANDPNLTYTDYGAYAKFFGLQGGRRGFDALKTMRQSMFNSMWDKVPDSIKSDSATAKEMARGYAEMVNHATGVISNTDRGFLATAARAGSPVAFAAKLEASRWARVIGDPIKTADTYARWNDATTAEKAVAIQRTKNAAEFAAGFLGTLYLNQAILSANDSKERINFTDPSKSDWLKHKIAGHTVAVDGGLLAPIRLLGRLTYDTLIRPRKELRGDTRTMAAIKDIGQYAIGKASPSVSIAKEAITGESFEGRLLPWSRDTSKKPRMTWTEYATSHGPIPLSGATKDIYDSMRERGLSSPDAKAVLRGLAAFGSELTGARVTEAPEERPAKPIENPTFGTSRIRR